MNHLARRVAAVLLGLATLALLGNPGPGVGATAAQSPAGLRPVCDGNGAITRSEYDARYGSLTIEGWLGCAQLPGGSLTFGLARYNANVEAGVLTPDDEKPYEPIAPTRFARTKSLRDIAQDFAICAVTHLEVRVACVHVTRAVAGGPVAIQLIPPSDPLVNKPLLIRDMLPPDPLCGSCW